ncbi:hypothetical protein BDW72DRAFT_188600 [Aspergillus terricola var. indicus]
MSHPLFQTTPELQIMICRQCKHAVHPIEVETHLRKKHRMTTSQVQPVVEIVQQWTNLIQDPDAIYIPPELENPLPNPLGVEHCSAMGLGFQSFVWAGCSAMGFSQP